MSAAALAVALTLSGCSPSDDKLLASAREHMAKREYEPARLELKTLLQKNGQNGEARLLLGKTMLALGDPAGAEAELRRALEYGQSEEAVLPALATALNGIGKGNLLLSQYPNVQFKGDAAAAEFGTQLALAQLQANAPREAEAALAEALRRQPDYLPAQVMGVRLKASRNEIDAALADIKAVAAKHPDDAPAQALLGDLLAAKGQSDEAVAAWKASLKLSPRQPNLYTAAISALIAKKDMAGTQALFDEMQKAMPQHPQTVFFDAMLAAGRGDYGRTRELTQQLLRAAPENPRLLLLAGEAELKLNNPSQADALFTKAVQLAPKLPAARRLLAQAQLQARQPAKVLATLAPLLDAKPADPEALALAAQAQLMTGNVKGADQSFAKAAELRPDNARLQAARALTHLGQGNDASVLGELEGLAAKDKGDKVDLALIGARLRTGDIAGAAKAVDRLAAKSPKSPVPEQLRGLLSLHASDRAAARGHFDKALALNADYLPALVKLAELDVTEGKNDAARARFEDLLKRQPKNIDAMQALSDIAVIESKDALAIEWLEKAVKAGPTLTRPRQLLIDRLVAQRQYARALEAAQAATTAIPDNPLLLERLGRTQLLTERGTEAVTTINKLASLNPKAWAPLLLLADAQAQLKNDAGVAEAIRRAQEAAPDEPTVVQAAVTLAMRNRKPDQALAAARKLQAARPKDPLGLSIEADIEASQQHWDAAAAAYRKVIELNGKDGPTAPALRLHHMLTRAGKAADADRLAADWQKARPKDPGFPMYFGDEAMARKDFATAERHYGKALELQPGSTLALNNMAYVLATQHKPGAVEMAEKAVKAAPNQATLLDTLAYALEADDKVGKAVEVQAKAVAIAPDAPALRLQLARLRIKAGDKAAAREDLRTLEKLGERFPRQAEVAELMAKTGK